MGLEALMIKLLAARRFNMLHIAAAIQVFALANQGRIFISVTLFAFGLSLFVIVDLISAPVKSITGQH